MYLWTKQHSKLFYFPADLSDRHSTSIHVRMHYVLESAGNDQWAWRQHITRAGVALLQFAWNVLALGQTLEDWLLLFFFLRLYFFLRYRYCKKARFTFLPFYYFIYLFFNEAFLKMHVVDLETARMKRMTFPGSEAVCTKIWLAYCKYRLTVRWCEYFYELCTIFLTYFW